MLIANAWHHRTDAVSSVVALLAIAGSMCGAPMLDPIAGLMVAGMVALTGVQVCCARLWGRLMEMCVRLPPGMLFFGRVLYACLRVSDV